MCKTCQARPVEPEASPASGGRTPCSPLLSAGSAIASRLAPPEAWKTRRNGSEFSRIGLLAQTADLILSPGPAINGQAV